MRTIVWISCLIWLAAGCDRADELRYEEQFDPESFQTVSIAYLRSLCRGDGLTISEPAVIEGRVTANDLYGEFYKCIWVEDNSGGIELRLDQTQLYRRYPLGAPLRIFCEGLALGNYAGRILLGAPPTAEQVVDRIPEEEFSLRLHLLDESCEPLPPEDILLEEVGRDRIGRFVRLCGIRFIDEEAGCTWCDTDPLTGLPVTTTRHLCDDHADTIELRTLSTCRYATEPLPDGKGSVCGILDCFNGVFQLRTVNHGWTGER